MADDNNLKQINDLFKRLKEKGVPTLSLMQKISGHLEENIHENLSSEGKGSPIPWAQLSAKYAKRKSKNTRLVQKILTASGSLDQSIFQRTSELEAAAGTNKLYAGVHQFGGTIYIDARTRTIFHRTDAKGNLLRRSLSGDEDDNYMLIFAKKSHKRKVAYTFGQNKYIIKMPARPFLYVTDHYMNLIINDIKNYYSHL